jgi:hypothetical protein
MQLVLTEKSKKPLGLCEIEGYENVHDLIQAVAVCPAICSIS